MSKPTPGPWSVFEHRDHSGLCIGPRYEATYFTDGEVRDVCTITSPRRSVNDEERANARLIASAPDLLAALQKIAQLQDDKIQSAPADIVFALLDITVQIARAAIALATGGI